MRLIKIIMIGLYASFFSLISLSNIQDTKSNFLFVEHVLSMDTTFHNPNLMKHAIINPFIWSAAYQLIVGWEILSAIILWAGTFLLILVYRTNSANFQEKKWLASCGLFCGFLLYMGGFLVIGGEWFSMWQSQVWNGQMKAGLFAVLILLMLIFLQQKEL